MAGTETKDRGAPRSGPATTGPARWRLVVAAAVVIGGIALAVALATGVGHGGPTEVVTVADDQVATSTTTAPVSTTTTAAAPEETTTTSTVAAAPPTTSRYPTAPTTAAPAPPPPPTEVDPALYQQRYDTCMARQQQRMQEGLASLDAQIAELEKGLGSLPPDQQAYFDARRANTLKIGDSAEFCAQMARNG